MTIDDLLIRARKMGASDVHVTVGIPPKCRVNGELVTAFKSAASVNSKYATEVNKMTTATASASLNADLKKKIESYLEKSLAETEKGLSSKNCTGKKFYFQKSDKGFKVYIGDASGAAKDSDEVEFSTTPASN